jgi:hypothetical protein
MSLIGNKFADDVISALNGLVNRGADRFDIIRTLAGDENEVVISELDWWQQNFSNGGYINWSSEGGLIHEDGKGRHSPAVSLIHELGHAYYTFYDPIGKELEMNQLIEAGDWDGLTQFERKEQQETGGKFGFKNYEEMWVIKKVEHFATKALNQSQRNSHGKAGKYKAKSLFSTESLEDRYYPQVKH